MYVHVCVCMYICMYVCMHLGIYVCMYACAYIHAWVDAYLCVCVCVIAYAVSPGTTERADAPPRPLYRSKYHPPCFEIISRLIVIRSNLLEAAIRMVFLD